MGGRRPQHQNIEEKGKKNTEVIKVKIHYNWE
jgi:hypothetical protein